MQWNVRGVITHFHELKNEILKRQPVLAAIQETHFRDGDQGYPITGYSWYCNNVNSETRKGGAAILVRNDMPHRRVKVNTDLNCVAVSLKVKRTAITVISAYFSPSSPEPSNEALTALITQINTPVLFLGDINAHSPIWGSRNTSARGYVFQEFLADQNLVVLNTGQNTRFNPRLDQNDTAIDISCCSARIERFFDWSIENDPLFSDHYPIVINLGSGSIQTTVLFSPSWNLKRADWNEFENLVDHKLVNSDTPNMSTVLEAISDSAHIAVPKSKGPRPKPSAPWWNQECNKAFAIRRRAHRRFKRCMCEAHHLELRKSQAICRKTIRKQQKHSWREHISRFNRFTPMSKIWKLIKCFNLKRSPPGPFPQLKVDGQEITDPDQVMNAFARHYASVSANTNFVTGLLGEVEELASRCDFTSENNEDYNQPFTPQELSLALSKCGNTSVGPDDIHYSFFRHLSKMSQTYLLNAINEMVQNDSFPASWQESIVIPIPKPKKDITVAKSYRPISLTSCACKLVERMYNTRLRYFLETKNLLDPNQCGFRQNRSTTDNVLRLVQSIQKGFPRKKYTLAVYLDITAAFDRVLKPALKYRLHTLGLRGHLPKFILNFLENRTFKVRCGKTFSDPVSQDQGLPQGSVLSPTLFLVAINDMFKDMPPNLKNRIQYSLFADDVAIWATGRDVYIIEEIVQQSLDYVSDWCKKWGLTLSPEKSAAVLYRSSRKRKSHVLLKIDGKAVSQEENFKFLGVNLDETLSFKWHMKEIQQKCTKRVNVIRALSGTTWGGDRKTLLHLYRAIIRPIIEYCSMIYHGCLTETQAKKLETIQNQCIRAATGALLCTPIPALLADADMQSCVERRNIQLCRYYIKAQTNPNPDIRECFKYKHGDWTGACKTKLTFSNQIATNLRDLDLEIPSIAEKPALKPFWLTTPPQVEFLFSEKKDDISPQEIQAIFHEFREKNAEKTFLYTDGSKIENRVGMAVAGEDIEIANRLPDKVSIFTAEAMALLTAVRLCRQNHMYNVIICSDSKSVLQTVSNTADPPNYIIDTIQKSVHPNVSAISFLWIPGHANIKGNEKADQLAKASLEFDDCFKMKFTVGDCLAIHSQHERKLRQRRWEGNHPTHIFNIKPTLGTWATSNQNCRQNEKILTRLRTGKTRLYPSFPEQLTCEFCYTEPTISHILLDCPEYELARDRMENYCRDNNIELSLKNLLGDKHPDLIKLLFTYLHDTNLMNQI